MCTWFTKTTPICSTASTPPCLLSIRSSPSLFIVAYFVRWLATMICTIATILLLSSNTRRTQHNLHGSCSVQCLLRVNYTTKHHWRIEQRAPQGYKKTDRPTVRSVGLGCQVRRRRCQVKQSALDCTVPAVVNRVPLLVYHHHHYKQPTSSK